MTLASQIRGKAAALWHLRRVKQLVRDLTGAGQMTLITVVELDCRDPACPGPTTQISVMGPDLIRKTVTLHKPVRDVQLTDLVPGWRS